MNLDTKINSFLERHEVTPENILLVCFSLWLTALATRAAIFWLVYHGAIPAVFVRGYHIHHFVTGFILLVIAYLLFRRQIFSKYIPLILLGSGLALTFDEFIFWTRGHFDYWSVVNLLATLVIGCSIVLFYLYAKRQDLGHLSKKRIAATLLPVIVFSALLYALFHFDNLLSSDYQGQINPHQTVNQSL